MFFLETREGCVVMYMLSLLSCPSALQLYRTKSLRPPGHTDTALQLE